MKRVTILDVAKEAGVSIKTVSNVLNDSGSMRPQTRERVRQAIERLGYVVNSSARSLKRGRSGIIGLATMEFSQPWSSLFVGAVIAAARKRGLGLITDTYADSEGLPGIIAETRQVGADGWIFYPDRPLEEDGAVLDQPYPVVLAGDYLSYGKADHVTEPHLQAVANATHRLIDSGCRRIGLIGAPENWWSPEAWDAMMSCEEGTREIRTRAFAEACEARGMTSGDYLIAGGGVWNSSSGGKAARELLKESRAGGNPLDAIMCLNDALALGALHAIREDGLRVPDDIQVIGFDNVPESEYSDPPLTTVDASIGQYADLLVSMLVERIEGYDGPARTLTTDFSLVERASTRLK